MICFRLFGNEFPAQNRSLAVILRNALNRAAQITSVDGVMLTISRRFSHEGKLPALSTELTDS